MDLERWKDLALVFQAWATTTAILVGGGWAFWNYVLQREGHGKIEFLVDLRVIGPLAESVLIEVMATVENKGRVGHWITDFTFDLLQLDSAAHYVQAREFNEQTKFELLFRERRWTPKHREKTFVDPGVLQHYTYVTAIPPGAAFLLVFSKFKYLDKESEFHTAQRAFFVDRKSHFPSNSELPDRTA